MWAHSNMPAFERPDHQSCLLSFYAVAELNVVIICYMVRFPQIIYFVLDRLVPLGSGVHLEWKQRSRGKEFVPVS
ncbi:hypothetical protein EUTSA_v10026720mg [Eutrema salsugineum]|uniref:Uncharacterized protein n=1 Tax=Eutrema salsugineum TaxID=72664 RepID=V4MJ52_EUTSA|nr:hypothetical protein EUTSA_v10026720mg [Eutrema salsugineum]